MPKFNEPVDYAFFSSKKKTDTPILLLEAKRLGSDLAHKNHVKQLTAAGFKGSSQHVLAGVRVAVR